jgi:hypothetical protein
MNDPRHVPRKAVKVFGVQAVDELNFSATETKQLDIAVALDIQTK